MNRGEDLPTDIESIALKFLDLVGQPREIRIPPDKFDSVCKNGVSFDSSSLGLTSVNKSDMVAIPKHDTMRVKEERGKKIAIFLCEIHWPDGSPFRGDPRFLLRDTLETLSERNIHVQVKPEYEFYLFDPETYEPMDEGEYIGTGRDVSQVLGDLSRMLKRYDIKFEKIHHEVGHGQYEVEPVPYKDPIKAADDSLLIKELIKKVARENDAFASFMPKPMIKEPGNGLHVHISLYKGDEYLFSPEKLNESAKGFVGGLLHHAKALSAVCSPTINSYKRLIPGYEAPVYISWGGENRSVLVRIPGYGSEEESKGRVEYRAGDPTANIYLMLNALICAGREGMEKSLDPGKEVTENLYELEEQEIKDRGIEFLPNTLSEALQELKQEDTIKDSLGEAYPSYMRMKRKEVSDFRTNITEWEKEEYL